MKSYKVAVIPGDGIGVEVVKSSIEVLNKLQEGKNFKLEFNEFDWSSEYYFKHGKMMPEDGIKQLENHDAIFLGGRSPRYTRSYYFEWSTTSY